MDIDNIARLSNFLQSKPLRCNMAPPLLLAGMLLLSTPSVTVATNDASDCMAVFSSGFKRSGTTTARCKLLADFKKCNEGVDGDDTLRQVSLDLYEDKVATEPACGMTARPSIAVVDRSIRVTSEKEVLFQRCLDCRRLQAGCARS